MTGVLKVLGLVAIMLLAALLVLWDETLVLFIFLVVACAQVAFALVRRGRKNTPLEPPGAS